MVKGVFRQWQVILAVGLFFVLGSFNISAAAITVCPSLCENEYSSIQEAINAASDGDTVLVDDGVYVENINFLGKAITVKSVSGAGSTIIDGNASGSVVTFINNESPDAVLDGFTLTNGSGNPNALNGVPGGGIYCGRPNEFGEENPSPTIRNCVITGNKATKGGGIACDYASPTINNCLIGSNSAGNCGGGIHTYVSSVTIGNCIISNNSAGGVGGGISSAVASSLTISNSRVSNNIAGVGTGGGINCFSNPFVTITNCEIKNNSAGGNGGGVHLVECIRFDDSSDSFLLSAKITNCTINGNSSGSSGGGLYCEHSTTAITNCNITKNSANGIPEFEEDLRGLGGGLFCWLFYDQISNITNCTISGNTATQGGGGLCSVARTAPVVTNSILWGNTAADAANEIYLWWEADPIVISFSDVWGGWTGEGNIDADPLFVNVDSNDYHLTPNSPCVDVGTPVGAPSDDIDGDARGPRGKVTIWARMSLPVRMYV